MADNRIQFTFEINDKGKVKVDGLTKSFVSLDNAVNKVSVDLKRQQTALAGASKGHQSMISDAGLAGATLTEFGRTISDSNYGIRGMANNLSQLASLFTTLVSKRGGGIKGVNLAFKQLGRQLLGPLGIILAFQSLIAMLEGYAISNEKTKDEVKDLTDALDDQIISMEGLKNTALGVFGEEKGLLTVGGKRTKALRQEFKEFDKAVRNLEKSGNLNNETLTNTYNKFFDLVSIQQELSELEKTRPDLKEQEDINKFNLKRIELLSKVYDLRQDLFKQSEEAPETTKKFKEFVALSIEELADIFREGAERDVSLFDLFGISADIAAEDDKKFQKWLNDNVPEYIDDVEDFVDTQLLNEGKHTLTEMILGLTPDSREKELAALRDKFDEILYETKEFKLAEAAINEKYDIIERQEKFDHYSYMIGGLADFLDKAAQLNEQNKGLAKLSIIASAAAASIGIWESWFVKDKTFSPAPVKLAGAIATQGALVASTVAALRSLNSGTAPGQDSGGAGAGASQAPIFNVVGQSNVDQLGRSIATARQEPLRAYVVESDITNAQQLENARLLQTSIG
ncbi:MAG: hypothetical protein CL579_05620 [Alteromonadaceae bacterium]|nr:hypothetical protein [Alteromonadaceae bacterium]